jgi:hypothetical protein
MAKVGQKVLTNLLLAESCRMSGGARSLRALDFSAFSSGSLRGGESVLSVAFVFGELLPPAASGELSANLKLIFRLWSRASFACALALRFSTSFEGSLNRGSKTATGLETWKLLGEFWPKISQTAGEFQGNAGKVGQKMQTCWLGQMGSLLAGKYGFGSFALLPLAVTLSGEYNKEN